MKLKRSVYCGEVTEELIGKNVIVSGFVSNIRNKGGLIFVNIRDIKGIVQVILNESEADKELYDIFSNLKMEYVVSVEGLVVERSSVNEKLKTGKVEIIAKNIEILSKSDVLPFQIEENSNTRDDLRLTYRALDLRRPDLQKNLVLRSKVAMIVRNYLVENGFLEIETPFLTKSTPEGARDYLVPSRVHKGEFYALPQSPQLFKQLLMCAGYDRYFQIVKCFRDEDLRSHRQPEFTQIDMELSFVDSEDVISISEKLIQKIFKETLDVDIKLPIMRMEYDDAMENYGSDKPDIRFDMKLHNITDVVKDIDFPLFNVKEIVSTISVPTYSTLSRKKIDYIVQMAKDMNATGLPYIAVNEDGTYKCSFSKFVNDEQIEKIVKASDAQKGDMIFICADNNKKVVYQVLGTLRLHFAEELGYIDDNVFAPLWVVNFPLLEWNEEDNRYTAEHHPFTMPKEEDLKYIETKEYDKIKSKTYDIVINGVEVGGGSERIYDNEIQELMFKLLGFEKEVAREQFGFLLDAFKYGVPPHAGIAYGFDRLMMLLTKSQSIRDVIAFPKVKDASCLLTKAPSPVSEKQLKELGIKCE